jgi:hypothetical protein
MMLPPSLILFALSLAPSEALELAARCHEAGHFAAAAAIYDQFDTARFSPSGDFYLAQGNAHFLAGHLPEAILAYCRAERGWHAEERIRENLTDARSRVVDPPRSRAWSLPGSRFSHAVAALVSYALAWCALGLWVARPNRKRLLIVAALFASCLLLGIHIGYESWRHARFPVGVVKTETVALRMGNGETYPPVLENGVSVLLHRGVEIHVRAARPNGWLQVELDSGLLGWIRAADILYDTPRTTSASAAGLGG